MVVGALALAVGSAVVALHLGRGSARWSQRGPQPLPVPWAGCCSRRSTPWRAPCWASSVGVLVATLHALFDQLPSLERRWPSLAAVTLPVTVTGILVYVVGRVLVG